jgi:hypothetical protein
MPTIKSSTSERTWHLPNDKDATRASKAARQDCKFNGVFSATESAAAHLDETSSFVNATTEPGFPLNMPLMTLSATLTLYPSVATPAKSVIDKALSASAPTWTVKDLTGSSLAVTGLPVKIGYLPKAISLTNDAMTRSNISN